LTGYDATSVSGRGNETTKVELFINLKAAKALNLNVLAQMQQLADEVIE
jgi:hypothetical protein